MAAKLAHIAIEADDVPRAKKFYEDALGWTFEPWGPPNFYHIKGAGVHGALQERRTPSPEGRKGVECTFAVKSLQTALEKLQKAGGTVVGKPFEIEIVGVLAPVQDTEQNEFILMEYAPAYAKALGIDLDE